MKKTILTLLAAIILIIPCRVLAFESFDNIEKLNPSIEMVKQFSDLVQVHKFKYYKFNYVTQDYAAVYHCTKDVDHFYGVMAEAGKAFRWSGSCYTSTSQAKEAGITPQARKYRSERIVDYVKKEKDTMIAQEKNNQERIENMISELSALGYSITK